MMMHRDDFAISKAILSTNRWDETWRYLVK